MTGPSFFFIPLAMKSRAFSEPRYGVPNVMSSRVSFHPSSSSRKCRQIRPPIEWPMRTSFASSLPERSRQLFSHAWLSRASRRAWTRLSRRQS